MVLMALMSLLAVPGLKSDLVRRCATGMSWTGTMSPSLRGRPLIFRLRSSTQVLRRGRGIRPGRPIDGMGGVKQRLAVTADGGIVGRAVVEDVEALVLPELLERLGKPHVGGLELALVEIVADGLARPRVAKPDLVGGGVVDVTLAGVVVELGGAAFLLELRIAQKRHLSLALDR